jgi:hypothetical protein
MTKRVFQTHHISYNPEVTVKLTKGEHWVITHLNRHKYVTKGFITALKVWIALHENEAKTP